MRRFYTLFVMLVVLGSRLNVTSAQVVRIPDPYLQAAVRQALSLAPGESLTQEAMLELKHLEYHPFIPTEDSEVDLRHYLQEEQINRGNEVTQLIGLEYATNLEHLAVDFNQIIDLTPLAGLTQLEVLSLSENQINDLTPLVGLTQLKALNLFGNQISDLTLLAGLTQLDRLSLGRNSISDLTPLVGLTQLKWLGLGQNPISDFTPLAGLTQLEELGLAGNQVSDLTFLAGLTQLKWLNLEYNQIRDITLLTGLTQLRALWLEGNQIRDITVLERLTNLEEWLGLGGNQISDLTPLAGLVHLTGLGLENNRVSDLTPLSGLTQLERLDLGNNQISNLTPLAGFTRLHLLDLGCNQINDITPLTQLTQLKTLVLVGNQVTNKALDPLNRLPNLTLLWVSGNSPPRPTIGTFHSTRQPSSFYHQGFCPTEEPLQAPSPKDSGTVGGGDEGVWPPIFLVDRASNTLHGIMRGILEDETENLALSVQNVTSLAVDISGGKLYWTEKTSDSTSKIWQANLDGSTVEVLKELTSVPLQITLDAENGKLYLTNSWGKIQRMNLDGTDFQPNLITGLEAPSDVTVDVSGGKIYWIEKTGDTTGRIRRADLDGSNIELVKELSSVPLGIALDTEAGKLYLTNDRGKIQRMNLDGTDFQPNFITGLEAPTGIAVSGDNIYWIEEGNIIRRASLNDKNIYDVVRGLSSITVFALGMLPPVDMPSTTDDEETTDDTETVGEKTTDDTETVVFAAADVNEDGKVNKADLLLVITGLGETSPTNPRLDVDSDGTVAIADLLLVVENLDDPRVGAAPTVTGAPTPVDPQVLAEHLNLLRMTSDGSVKYLRAIAFLEGVLAAMRPVETRLLANYPNPFNPETWIPYQLATDADVQILIYDAQGVLVRRLVLGYQPAGYYTGSSAAAYWDGRNSLGERVASGVYFYQLLTNEISSLRKMVILK